MTLAKAALVLGLTWRLGVSHSLGQGQGTLCMPNSSNVIRSAPLAEALAHFVLRVDVVCAMRTT